MLLCSALQLADSIVTRPAERGIAGQAPNAKCQPTCIIEELLVPTAPAPASPSQPATPSEASAPINLPEASVQSAGYAAASQSAPWHTDDGLVSGSDAPGCLAPSSARLEAESGSGASSGAIDVPSREAQAAVKSQPASPHSRHSVRLSKVPRVEYSVAALEAYACKPQE